MKYNEKSHFRKHKNNDIVTNTSLVNPDHASPSGLCSICVKEGKCEVGKRARTGETLFPRPFGTAQFGAEKKIPSMEDLQIMPELYGPNIDFDQVEVSTELGGFEVSAPLAVASMGSTQVAHTVGEPLAKGAAEAGIPLGIGENVWVTYGEEGLKNRMNAYLDHYEDKGALIVQLNENERKQGLAQKATDQGAHALELKLGQGAKQGLGGEIRFQSEEKAKKYRKWGFKVKENPDGSYQRHAQPGSLSNEQLEDVILEIAEHDLPVWVKTGMGKGITKLINKLDDINRDHGQVVDMITVDGYGGGTGMSPWLVMNEMNLPSGALFDKLDSEVSFDITLAGGYNSGMDVAKGMMLGANGVAMGRSFLIAANALDEGEPLKDEGVKNYVNALKEELRMVTTTLKEDHIEDIVGKRDNLLSLSEEAEKMFGVTSSSKEVI